MYTGFLWLICGLQNLLRLFYGRSSYRSQPDVQRVAGACFRQRIGDPKAVVLSQGNSLNKSADWSLPLDGKTNHTICPVVG